MANKSDRKNEAAHVEKMVKIMNDFLEIETVIECSAKILKNVSEIFFYAQKSVRLAYLHSVVFDKMCFQVIYPFRPLFQVEERELTNKCKRALVRIFKVYHLLNT